jgi:chromosome segregation ATPase
MAFDIVAIATFVVTFGGALVTFLIKNAQTMNAAQLNGEQVKKNQERIDLLKEKMERCETIADRGKEDIKELEGRFEAFKHKWETNHKELESKISIVERTVAEINGKLDILLKQNGRIGARH